MGKYFRTDDKEVLEETYELSIETGFTVPPYPAGIPALLQDLERTMPKAKARSRKTSSTTDWCASWIRAAL